MKKFEAKLILLCMLSVVIAIIGIWQPHNEVRAWVCIGLQSIPSYLLYRVTK